MSLIPVHRAMEELIEFATTLWGKIRYIRAVNEASALLVELMVDLFRLLAKMAALKLDEERVQIHLGNYPHNFWLSPTFRRLYAVLFLAVLTRQAWILYGIVVIILGKISEVALRWTLYTLDDEILYYNAKYISDWVLLFLNQGEDIMNGGAAWKLALTYSAVWTAPTGMSVFRYFVRYKTVALRQEFIRELGDSRFDNIGRLEKMAKQLSIAQGKTTAAISAVQGRTSTAITAVQAKVDTVTRSRSSGETEVFLSSSRRNNNTVDGK